MRLSGHLIVVATFVAVASLAFAVIALLGVEQKTLATIVAAIAATQVGVLLWHRQAPTAALGAVKVRLGLLLGATVGPYLLALQALTGQLAYPEVTIPIAVAGCFGFPFVLVGTLWKALAAPKPPAAGK
jgi:hypothetical protein